MGVVTVSSSASQTPLGLSTRFTTRHAPLKRPLILAFKTDKTKNTALIIEHEPIPLPADIPKEQKRLGKTRKSSKRVKAVSTDKASPCTIDLDYGEAAAKLENIYKLSPPKDISDMEDPCNMVRKRRQTRKKAGEGDGIFKKQQNGTVVRNHKKVKRMSLRKRIELRSGEEEEMVVNSSQGQEDGEVDNGNVDKLVREYSISTDLISLNWKNMKIPPVLPSSEHAWLFRLMQPMKPLLQVKENLQKDLGREPIDGELATAMNMSVPQLRRQIEVAQAARSKLIKVRVELQRAKLELMFKLKREPTEEEIIEKVGISPKRYHEVMRASKPVFSLHARHKITQEEFINGITDVGGVGGDKRTQLKLLRLALDDVLDSLKPKESLVIRQRYGLDGKGDRTLGEIAGNLNISREMVRKHEVKALMKLKHPTRVDYLRGYIF